ncbi:acyltransferase [Magnetospirillum fulvum MGU-K5]|uniref:Acyltransferase n=2 Tax=Magnetospirillum fulvum TaxID=1082 RepID=S9S6K1_MAGFU|nr:acyltransferase [Magnetospirillum fulvum MGU-K5]
MFLRHGFLPMKPCALIPSRNHWTALPAIIATVRRAGLPILVIDDGSDEPAASALAALNDPDNGVSVTRLPVNQGKGIAVATGFRLAAAQGFTHAVQIDADGQHDLDALPRLLAAAEANPDALISGAPLYDDSIPTGRKIGRWITHLWVFVETLSFRISDSMCGFRVYPLAACLALLDREPVGRRMDFDTDIMVRLFWRGIAPVMVPVKVTYPPGNLSNFAIVADNVRISWMHTRLVTAMLWRLPGILYRRLNELTRHIAPRRAGASAPLAAASMAARYRPTGQNKGWPVLRHRPPRPAAHWAGLGERGALWGLALVAAAYRWLGRRACAAVIAPIVLYFYLSGTEQRRASLDYLGRVLGRPARFADGFRHFRDFASRALDAFAAWKGAIPPAAMEIATPETLAEAAATRRGALLVVSHHGNAELSRALMDPNLRARLTVLVHTRHAENYNRLLARHHGDAPSRTIQVAEIGPDTAILLRERIEQGEWVAIAGDRVPVLSQGRVSRVPFLGAMAEFSHGPWLLAALLDCPVYLLFCRRIGEGRWSLSLEPFAERIVLPRGRRAEALAEQAARYAARLEAECRAAPTQWYNFFSFWAGKTDR